MSKREIKSVAKELADNKKDAKEFEKLIKALVNEGKEQWYEKGVT